MFAASPLVWCTYSSLCIGRVVEAEVAIEDPEFTARIISKTNDHGRPTTAAIIVHLQYVHHGFARCDDYIKFGAMRRRYRSSSAVRHSPWSTSCSMSSSTISRILLLNAPQMRNAPVIFCRLRLNMHKRLDATM